MKKNIFLTLTFFVISMCSFAQFVDNDAKDILDRVARELQRSTGTKAEFTLLIENNQTGEKQTLNGTIFLKNDRFKLSLLGVETFYNGSIQWVYMPDDKEVTISVPTAEELAEVNPTAIISSYTQGYKLRKEGDKTVNGKQAFMVNIHPEDRTKPFHRIEILVEKGTYNILSINTYGKNGTNTRINIKKMEKNLNFPDNMFIFEVKNFPDVEVVDLR